MNPTVNADPAELAKFSDLAHRWWDPESEFRPLHQINPLRLAWIDGLAALAGKTVLDVGCGGGILSDSMARKGAQVTGIDLSVKALKVAQLHALEAGTAQVNYREVSAEALAQEQPGSFDVVTCMEMLEHVPDPASVVRACCNPGQAGRLGVLSPPSTATPRPFCLRSWVPSTCCRCCRKARMSTPKSSAPVNWPAIVAPLSWSSHRPAAWNTTRITRRYWLSADTSVNYLIGDAENHECIGLSGAFQAVLFDLDGTLIDSAPDLGAAADLMRTRRGLRGLPLARWRPLAGAGARGMLRVAFDTDAGTPDL